MTTPLIASISRPQEVPPNHWHEDLCSILSSIQKLAFEIFKTTFFVISLPITSIFTFSSCCWISSDYIFESALFLDSIISVKIYLAVRSIFSNPQTMSCEYLNLCIDWNRMDTLRLLLSENVPVNDAWGSTPSMVLAVQKNNLELVNLLLSHGAKLSWDTNTRSGDRSVIQDALFEAQWLDNLEMIKLLIKKGAPLNLRIAGHSHNPIFIFINSPHYKINQAQKIKILELLLKSGANPNHNSSSEPLANAIICEDEEAVGLLLRYGAKTDLPTGQPYFLYKVSSIEELVLIHCRNTKIVNLIMEKLPKTSTQQPQKVSIDAYYKAVDKAIPVLKTTTFENGSLLEILRIRITKDHSSEKLPLPEKLLGLDSQRNFSLDDVKTAYKKLVIHAHPDKHSSSETVKEVFVCLNEAYQYLTSKLKA